MTVIKYILLSILFFPLAHLTHASEPEAAKMRASDAVIDSSRNMTGFSSPAHQDGVSSRNKMFAKAAYILSLLLSLATLTVFFIARRNAKTNYNKAKKFFIIGLVLFALVVILFLLPKLFLSYSFPGNFDMRAT